MIGSIGSSSGTIRNQSAMNQSTISNHGNLLESDLDTINPNETLNLLTKSSKLIDQQLLDKLESDLKTARSE